ncbi:hypothetical protein LTR53_001327 [Teratosphaeriaceae sp. CCFEE 6253]|nr:hypothetical protein LTR53_001327 [Teratosphaeriaceae sp. CCFEE 6253]
MAVAMSSCLFSRRRYSIILVGIYLFGLCFFALLLFAFWYASNSDKDNIPPWLTHLLPAGHCACKTSTHFGCAACLDCQTAISIPNRTDEWRFEYLRDGKDETLTASQCLASFPGLFEDIDHRVQYWSEHGNITNGMLDTFSLVNSATRARIHNGNLYVVATKSRAEDHRRKMLAILSSIHRAIITAPDRAHLPTMDFIFSIEDKATDIAGARHPLWVVARKADEQSLWLMPDFGYWAWDNIVAHNFNNEVGPLDEVVDKAIAVEQGLPFHEKKAQLVWRGKLSFAPRLRRALLDQSRNHDWADVRELDWTVPANYLTMQDHCRYQFIAHAEGRSYSASLKYRQACNSVLIIHKLQYIQHHHYLLIHEGPLQNYVEVERDFSDLSDKMANLLDHPEKAAKIAANSVKTFRERYLTPAAEACYWRALWRGYAKVFADAAEPIHVDGAPGARQVKRGMRYETFILIASHDMLDFSTS